METVAWSILQMFVQLQYTLKFVVALLHVQEEEHVWI